MPQEPELLAHREWLGYIQPVGLVVSPPALIAAQAHIDRNIIAQHAQFLQWVEWVTLDAEAEPVAAIVDLPGLLQDVLQWEPEDLLGGPGADPLPDDLEVSLPEYGETLRPTYAVREFQPAQGANPYILLIQALDMGTPFDAVHVEDERHYQASPHARFERLLREKNIPIGLLFNGTHLRLIYAPRGESSGHVTFSVQHMAEVAGRSLFAAFHLLLCAERLFTLPDKQRLPAILVESRKYQNLVSTRLSEQVLNALYELLRGFQAAHDQSGGTLLQEALRKDPNHIYGGLLTVLLRMVFILYAEERGLIATDPIYVKSYSISGLFERLRADDNRHPDTMDQRYGAWAQLLSLFRLIYDGVHHNAMRVPARHGNLFDPDRFPFLEGRPYGTARVMGDRIDPPAVSDGVVFRVLQDLLLLDGERISYRSLDVEQIGSVYETMMGFDLQVAEGRAIALKPAKRHGAPTTINLEAMLGLPGDKRAKAIQDLTDQKIAGNAVQAIQTAQTPEDLVAALGNKVSPSTPRIVPAGAMILQPSDERRRSGSHYTPRSLTEPIVRTTLRPILAQLGNAPRPEHILDLKICDPAMGSGAFLVETCRQLGDQLVKAWKTHDCMPRIPPDADELLHARRIIAQRCLYGVDKNPLAVDLAKLSLWLVTLARDHAFTFLDHALRHGDSLVGLSRDQIVHFNWEPKGQIEITSDMIRDRIETAARWRAKIQTAKDDAEENELRLMLRVADEALDDIRLIADLPIAVFFSADKPKIRAELRRIWSHNVQQWLSQRGDKQALADFARTLQAGGYPIVPFHWEIEFPEVFARNNPGFDAFVGNPPFAGKNNIINSHDEGYLDWLQTLHAEAHGNADLVAHFFRRAFNLLRKNGAFGLIATNTIRQGDTRTTGLRWICHHGGAIYNARRRVKWPGQAAVVVSVVHLFKGEYTGPVQLDGRDVPTITAFLFHAGGHDDPEKLVANESKSFIGSYVLGMGFTFDDTDTKGVASSIADMHRLIEKDPRNAERIFPYIGGEEVNNSPTQSPHRYVINFGDMTEEEAGEWPDLMKIVEDKVKPERLKQKREIRKRYWWRFGETTPALFRELKDLDRVIVVSRVSQYFSFVFLDSKMVFSEGLVVFCEERSILFAILQSRIHDIWARFFGSSLEERLRYTPSDCFETFPFPENFETHPDPERMGRAYYDYRAELMVKNNEGLTKTYNRFHDPEEQSPEIHTLRDLHDQMDRAVLAAYGWDDLHPTCEFLLDYEDEEEEDSGKSSTRKKPYRYRWPEDLHDEVLGRLLDLNKKRAAQERASGAAAEQKAKKTAKKSRVKKNGDQPVLF